MRQRIRYGVMIVGAVAAALYFWGMPGGSLFLFAGVVLIFLGATDFGRQCPLILSARNFISTLRSGPSIPVERLETMDGSGKANQDR